MPIRRYEDAERPKFKFRLRHLYYLVDLAMIAGLFLLGAHLFNSTVGVKKANEGERLRLVAKESGSRLLLQADSVVAATQGRLRKAEADSVRWAEDLMRRRVAFSGSVADLGTLNSGLTPRMNSVFDLRDKSARELQQVQQYEKELKARRADVVDLSGQADGAGRELAEATQKNRESIDLLANSRSTRTYEPVGLFPDRSGLLFSRGVSDTEDLTNVEFQHNVWKPGTTTDVGLALGFGLGSGGDVTSSKQLGVVVTRPLIHRRLGVDVGAGYSVLTNAAGNDETGAYASASLRLSPFYKERFHLGLGARADQQDVSPFISIGLGRR